MVMFGNSLLKSIALIYLRINLVRCLALNDCITPWTTGYVTEVVFGGKKIKSMPINPGTSGTPYLSSTYNLGCPFSISLNVLNLSSVDVLCFLLWLGHLSFTVLNKKHCIHPINFKRFEFSRHSNFPNVWNNVCFLIFFIFLQDLESWNLNWNGSFFVSRRIANRGCSGTWVRLLCDGVSQHMDSYRWTNIPIPICSGSNE